ncbi:GntR family transcriptional regulator/MocR family aminotransferase [Geodermatophilus bullaregiensis]|uniref:MocR-like pyridoxine biosynthesis transcription factor PdxR n=1 Tax=Geodermatophilus bullaregiensis TaxID=1564160 RepID=UPI00195E89F0|nr:PLP-dependent aminotransferase family protein [Geodermatophilus bullaregiensis]MBM7805357.1 GntR family transcriptional regulator/MocR family aminotransferase [Geodermatophilus bullaregiensis]
MRSPSGTDFLQLQRRAAPPRGLTAWLVAEVRTAVADGRLGPGSALPPTRTLARDLGVSRGVVVEAYQRLADEGVVVGRTGSGTVVAGRPAAVAVPPAGSADVAVPLLPARPPAGVDADLSPGVPDLSAFPRAVWLRAERAVLAHAAAADLGYGDPRGSARLRGELATWLARTRGLRVPAEGIVVVAGVAQSLALLAQVLRARGETAVAMEDPGSRGARDAIGYWGLDVLPVPVDGDGVRVDDLTATGARAAVLTPAHQFPTGVVLAPRRRRELLAWARAADGLVVEDDYDAEHRYDRAPVPALQAGAPDLVAHTGSTSKTLAPGMRLGWLVPPAALVTEVVAAKHANDLGSPVLPQLVLAELLVSGAYDRHLRQVRARQRARRDAVVAAVREHLPAARVEGAAAGLHLLLTLPAGDDVDLAARARDAGVLVHPLSWHRQRPGPPGLVLGYAAHTPDRLTDAVRRLGRALGGSALAR